MKKSIGLLLVLAATMVLGFQNCSKGGGGGSSQTATEEQPQQSSCVDLDFTATSLIYANSAHVIPDPPIQTARVTQNNVTTADVSMNLNLVTGALSVDDEGTVCTLTLAAQDLQAINSVLTGMSFCGETSQNATHNVTLRGANQEELSMDSPSANNIELAANASVLDLLKNIRDAAQDGIDNGNCSGNSNQGSSQNN